MTAKHTSLLMTALAAAVFVASTFAQVPRGADARPEDELLRSFPNSARATDLAHPQVGTEEAALARQADALTRQLQAADSDGQRSTIRTKLRDTLTKQFDARQKRHQHQIEALEAQVKKLKELVQKRQENREEIITRRLEQIQRDTQGLGW